MMYSAKYFLGLKVIACFKLIRGIGALLLAFSLYCSTASQWPACQAGAHFLSNSNVIAPLLLSASEWLNSFSQSTVFGLITAALAYSAIRFIEAVGIFLDKTWAEYLAVLTGLISLAAIGRQFLSQYSGALMIIALVNIAVLIYLVAVLIIKRRRN
ncbi:DUF2127 domain-containing protein [Polynucleobacter sp. AP-Melu-500A-A1]|uniref:DUF2127 domain-containing protein n=1 Tax=Polynucleobacter sp. AP-Melu-500A-A1 TaxID=2576929 RepID=UPI001C0CE629|nr:DUF2127 domain-containing protein [Polynucleobacter sp. AP-Melu-500A-A1]MBU3631477.1 DUF2127 domain-containing protein [Polynucleobacter sp. AP-Melu-500A-A1]